jgi:formate dehydrogenase major subunit
LDKAYTPNGHQAAYVVLGDEIPSERLVKNLEKSPFLVVQASHDSKLTAMADIVLPVTTWLEQGGHYLSIDGALQVAEMSLPVAGKDIMSNDTVLKSLAKQMNVTINGSWQTELLQRTSPVEITV